MALRNLHTDVKSALIENKSLNVFHLVKFEKPSNLPVTATKATDFVYLTDAFHDVEYEGSTYTAGGLLKIGTIQETIEAKASNINLEISATKLGANAIITVSCNAIGKDSSGTLSVDLNLFNSGFYPGDTVLFTDRSNPSNTYSARIDKLYGNGTSIDITALQNIPQLSNTSVTVSYNSPEVTGLVTSQGSELNYANYVNRDVEILRVYSDSISGTWVGEPVLLFKGIVSKGTLNHKASGGSKIVWNITSHWADFVRVQGRLTSDENHRALNAGGLPDRDAVIKPAYADDLGFEHATTALNVAATYTGTSTRLVSYRSGGLISGGLFGMRKYREEEYEVQRDLNLNLNLSAKFIPVVYGVKKVDSIPVFADVVIKEDTNSEDLFLEGSTTLYTANVLCEGPIGGIYDIYVDNKSLICKNQADKDVRGGSSPDDIPCLGLMERGNVLEGGFKYDYLFDISSSDLARMEEAESRQNPVDFPDSIRYSESLPPVRSYGPTELFATGEKGITHEKAFEWSEAGGLSIFFHAGLSDQSADAELRNLSQNMKFKVQRDYYTGTSDKKNYWSDNHRLLDTAYVVTKDFISEEDGRNSEHSYVVKGKYIDCHNYDGTYRSINSYDDFSNFNPGDEVTITLADGSTSSGEIIDKFSFYDLNGLKDGRLKVEANDSIVNTAILNNTAGRITVTKAGVGSWIMQSDNYTGNVSSPVESVENHTPIKYATDDIASLSTTIVRNATYEFELVCQDLDFGQESCTYQDVYYYEYIVDLSSLNTYSKNLLKALKGTLDVPAIKVVMTGSGKSSLIEIPLRYIDTVNWRIRERADNYDFGKFFNYFPQTQPTQGLEYTDTVNITVELDSEFAIVKDIEDPINTEDAKGLTITIEKQDETRIPRTILLPSDSQDISFLNSNDIIILNKKYPYTLGDSTYSYGSKVISGENTVFSDLRVSINPAMQLLDYLTSTRYGKGLDISLIDLESFKEVARACDEQSDVTILTTGSYTVGDTYKYPDTGTIQFKGTISKTKTVTYNSQSYTQVTFTDVIGKLGKKWVENKSYPVDTPVWHQDVAVDGTVSANFGFVTTEGSVNKPTTNTGTLSLYKVGSLNTLVVHTSFGSPEGNPFVKMIDDRGILVTGYSLYDSDDVRYWKYIGWDEHEQRYATRHQTNIVIDTSKPVFDNVNSMLAQFNGMLRYSNGKYYLAIKTKAKPLADFDENIEIITTDEIVGDIKIDDKGISKTYNAITSAILDPANDFEPRQLSFFNSTYLKEDKRVQRQGNYQSGGISNYFNARLNIKQVLDESRAGLTISFKVAPKGYLLLSGEIIALTYPKFNWENKLFRISSINVQSDLLVQIVATEHNDNAYILETVPSAIVEKYSSVDTAKPIVKLLAPTLNTPTNNGKGGVELTWTNSSNFKRASHTVQIWRSNTTSFDDAELVGYSKSDVFTDPVITGGQVTRYYWIRYSILQDSASSNTGQPVEKFSPYSPLTTEDGLAGTAEPLESAINVTIVSSNGGAVFKNNTGTEKVLSVLAFDAGTGQNVTSQITNYKWYKEGVLITLDGDNRVDPTGTVTADGNFPNIIVGPEDIADGSSELIEVEITI